MNASELETILLENLRGLRQQHVELTLVIQTLEDRQTESEKQLIRLSELYRHLLPLIESINKSLTSK